MDVELISFFVLISATFQLLLRVLILNKDKGDKRGGTSITIAQIAMGLLLNALLATPIMMVQMALLQLISGDTQGLPSNNSLFAVLAIYSLAVAAGFFEKAGYPTQKFNQRRRETLIPYPQLDYLPRDAISVFFLYLIGNMMIANPENTLSTGVHQTVGPCGEKALDLAGQEREIYLCPETHIQDFSFTCPGGKNVTPDGMSEWYTVCGKPHDRYSELLLGVTVLGLIGIFAYRTAFKSDPRNDFGKKRR